MRDGFYIQSSSGGYIAHNTARDLRYGLHYMFSDDNVFEGNETFTVKLTNPSGTNTISTATATGTINNDDTAATISISPAADVTEGAGVTSNFTVGSEASIDCE